MKKTKAGFGDFLKTVILLAVDMFSIWLSIKVAFWLRFYSNAIPVLKGIPPADPYTNAIAFVVLLYVIICGFYGLYRSQRSVSYVFEFSNILKAVTVCALIMMAMTFLYRTKAPYEEFSYSRLVVAMIWVISTVLMFFFRIVVEEVHKALRRKGVDLNATVIVGHGISAERIAQSLKSNLGIGYNVVGVLDNEPESAIRDAPYLGNIDGLENVVADKGITEVIITLPVEQSELGLAVLLKCEELGINGRIVPGIFQLMTNKVFVQTVDGIPIIGLQDLSIRGINRVLKRTLDIVCSSIALLILAIPMIIIALIIKASSLGKVFYRQERLGRDGKIFNMLKFRTMREDAEQATGPVWAKENDPRRTGIGELLRKTSIDELPQFINVFRGEMSLVGPRPERPFFVNKFKETIPRYMERHKVKSGITGWAQVHGLRGDTSIEERTKYDIYYIENWSIFLDIAIVIRTALTFFTQKNAY